MTFKDLLDKIETEYGITDLREVLMLRTAFEIIIKDCEEESILSFDICFENEKQRDDWNLTCSCGALFHCEGENEVNCFIQSNHYCSVCGRKLRFKN